MNVVLVYFDLYDIYIVLLYEDYLRSNIGVFSGI